MIRHYLRETATPMTGAALTLPLLCLYGLGTLLVEEARNGVDVISTALSWAFAAIDAVGWQPYAIFYGSLIVLNAGVIFWLKRSDRFQPRYFFPLLIECGLYAICTGTLSAYLTHNLLEPTRAVIEPLATTSSTGVMAGILISAGAGLHEELVFRLVGVAGVARLWLGEAWRHQTTRLLVVVVLNALLFAAVHHVVEDFHLQAFVFRTFASLLFAALFLLRGFAVAAWTHALYDVWVIVVVQN